MEVGCVLFLVLLIIAVIAARIAAINAARTAQQAKDKAHGAYQASLAQLKLDPANPNLRQETLRLGREYSNLTRDQKGVTVFDEVALSNDINAACAGAAVPRPASAPIAVGVKDRLQKLSSLKAQGLISDAEYEESRRRILAEM